MKIIFPDKTWSNSISFFGTSTGLVVMGWDSHLKVVGYNPSMDMDWMDIFHINLL